MTAPASSIDARAPAPERVARLRALLGSLEARARARNAVPRPERVRAPLPGELRETPHGPVQVVEHWLEPAHCHGRVAIRDALAVDPDVVARLALDAQMRVVDPRRLLFVDTETTGLSGGTGTLCFLVGLAWFEDESLRVEQLLLRRPGEEAPMLRLLAERLDQASCLVTFNGKSFDWPLLRTRFVLNRVATPLPKAHLDLLHCARRVYKRRLGAVRLVQLEEGVLGMRRERDIDGAEIPTLYLEYLRRGAGTILAPIVEHNLHDIVALAAILARLVHDYATVREDGEPEDHLSIAQLAARAADDARAVLFARAAARGSSAWQIATQAHSLVARVARRQGEHQLAALALAEALCAASPDALEASRVHLELAKLYEHRLRDPARALEHARACALAEDASTSARRVSRLEARIARAAGAKRRPARRRD